ncbi:MAG: ATP-binding cassette domain-containing protein [Desulfovibrionales bacterium]
MDVRIEKADLQILGSTVAEDLMLGLENTEDNTRLCRETASRLGLLEWWDTPVHALSWGQKRKLCLAATLLRQPAVLLFDEPFSGLDYPSATELRRTLAHNRAQGMTQVVAVHDLEPVLDLADRLLVLSRGVLALEGTPAEVLDHVAGHSVRPPCSWRLQRSLLGWE